MAGQDKPWAPQPEHVNDGNISDEQGLTERTTGGGEEAQQAPPTSPVAGIGAPAGGLEALRDFLEGIPAELELGLVIVPNLPPEHETPLAELLQPHTAMAVRQVTGPVRIEPNHVYVIAPNRNVSSIDTHLRLSPVEDMARERVPVDHFFRTLARSHGRRAIGVMLAGGGDGTEGLTAIKEAGGLVLAQDPTEAKFDSMPPSAMSMGIFDDVLPVREMGRRILTFLSTKPRLAFAGEEPAATHAEEAHADLRSLQKIFASVRAVTGHDRARYQRGTVERRLARRMQLRGISTLQDYLELLHAQPEEASALLGDLLGVATHFFCEPDRDAMIRELEEELASTKRELRAAVEEFEASKKEMKASNEELQMINEALARSRERYRVLVESTREYAMFTMDDQGLIDSWNSGARRILGWDEGEALGQPGAIIFVPEDREAGAPQRELRSAREQGQAMDERWHIRKDGSRFWGSGVVTSLWDGGTLRGYAKVMRDNTARKEAEEALRQSEERYRLLSEKLGERVEERTAQVRQLASELVASEQKVRHRIARTLHDDLQQILYAAEMQLRFVRDDTQPEGGEPRRELNELEAMLADSIRITRQLTVELSPPVLRGEGLPEAVEWLASHMSDVYGLRVAVEVSGEPHVRQEEQRVLLFQIVRELLFNVVKHAGVDEARVSLFDREDVLEIRVEDRGNGFDVDAVLTEEIGGFGLPSVHERVDLFGGRVEIDSQPGAGACVTLFLPNAGPRGNAGDGGEGTGA